MPAGDAGADAGGGGEDSPLLAVPPGSRNSPRLTPGSKGKVYNPVKSDKRNAGARRRSYASKYSREKSSATLRNTVPGLTDLQNVSKMTGLANGIYEQDASIYNLREQKEENRLFEINNTVRSLIDELEEKDKKNKPVEQLNETKA